MKKIVLFIIIVIVILMVGIVFFLGYLGFIPAIAHWFGSDKPRDLGVTWSLPDYQTAHQLTKVEISTATGNVSDKSSLVSEGSHPASFKLTGQQITAVINNNSSNWKYFPVSDMQVKINPSGFAEVSGLLYLNRLSGYAAATGANYGDIKTVMDKFSLLPEKIPFYLSGTASVQNNTANLILNQVELGRAPVPDKYLKDYKSNIDGFFTQQLNAFPGFFATEASLLGGNVNFDGTLADKVTTFK